MDVTVYVAESERRTGVGSSLHAELLSILARQGFNAAYAGIALPIHCTVHPASWPPRVQRQRSLP